MKPAWLFAAGDPGGARALIPVMHQAIKHGIGVQHINHGILAVEAPAASLGLNLKADIDEQQALAFFNDLNPKPPALIFASSVKDSMALTLARAGKQLGISLIHVLDNWTNYLLRLQMDGKTAIQVDLYTFIDQLALSQAQAEQVASRQMSITGQPALASLLADYQQIQQHPGKHLASGKEFKLVFISEPVTLDQGDSAAHPHFRGYTQFSVLQLLCQQLQAYAGLIDLTLVPHPRENVDQLQNAWLQHKGNLSGEISSKAQGRALIMEADGIIGMASLLLYEAWLLRKPVLSLQPGLTTTSLRMLEARQDVIFVDSTEQLPKALADFMLALEKKPVSDVREELLAHTNAATQIVNLIINMLEKDRSNS